MIINFKKLFWMKLNKFINYKINELGFKNASKEEKTDSLYNPLNRFFFIFLHSSKVENGWAIPILGCKLLPFSLGVYIFSFLMILYIANDLIEIPSMDYFQNHDKTFKLFFYMKL